MTLDFLESMDQNSLLDIVKSASIRLTTAPMSKIEVLPKQGVFNTSKTVTKVHNELNKLLAFSTNISNIHKSIQKGDLRANKQQLSEKRGSNSSSFESTSNMRLPDLGGAIDNLTSSLENLNLSGENGIGSLVAGAGAGVLAGRKGLLRTGVKVAGAGVAAYGAYKIASSAIPSMLSTNETEDSKRIPRATPQRQSQDKKSQAVTKGLTEKAAAALEKPVAEKKPSAVNQGSFSNRFADYIGNTFKNVSSFVSSIPERLANLGHNTWKNIQQGTAAVGDFVNDIGQGFNEGILASGAVEAPYNFVQDSLGIDAHKWDIYRNTIAQIESGGDYSKSGGSGNHYDGRYQMGRDAKIDAGKILGQRIPHTPDARAQFRANKDLQEKAFAAFTSANDKTLKKLSPQYSQSPLDKKLEVLGYAHNQGAGGAIQWLRTGNVGRDGFGTAGTKYSSALATTLKNPSATRRVANSVGEVIGNARDTLSGAITGAGQFLTPVIGKRISSRFGMRTHPVTGARRMHSGVDFGHGGEPAPKIYASAAGTVLSAGRAGGYGNLIQIQHAGGFFTRYGHLASIAVRAGERVGQGQPIGIMGTTGLSTGVHLHFEVRKGGPRGQALDPESVIAASRVTPSPRQAEVVPSAQQNAVVRRSNSRGAVNKRAQNRSVQQAPAVIVGGGARRPSRGRIVTQPGRQYTHYLAGT